MEVRIIVMSSPSVVCVYCIVSLGLVCVTDQIALAAPGHHLGLPCLELKSNSGVKICTTCRLAEGFLTEREN